MGSHKVISSDSHVFEPADLWATRVEPKFRDQAPAIVRLDDDDWWMLGDRRIVGMGLGSMAGVRFEDQQKLRFGDRYEHIRPGGYVPEEHVKDMESDGVDAGVIFPSVGFLLYNAVENSQLLTALFRAYNDWLGEFCKPFPNRLKGVACINVDDVQEGVEEMERCAKIGLAGALIPVYPPAERRYDSLEYEPLWAAAQDLGMSLNLHVSTIRRWDDQDPRGRDDKKRGAGDMTPSFRSNNDFWVRMSIGDIIFGGVFERYPKLRVGAVEHELAWIPHFLGRMDYTYTQETPREDWHRFKEDMLPSDYFHRNVFAGFQQDGLGVQLRNIIGVDNLMWGSDYPHPESTFPRSRQILENILADCTEEEKAKITGQNAANVYHIS